MDAKVYRISFATLSISTTVIMLLEVFQEVIVLGHMKNGVHNLVENIQAQPLGNEQVLLSIGAKQGTGIGLFIGVIAKTQIGIIAL